MPMKATLGLPFFYLEFIQLAFYQVKNWFLLCCMKFIISNGNIPVNHLFPPLFSLPQNSLHIKTQEKEEK